MGRRSILRTALAGVCLTTALAAQSTSTNDDLAAKVRAELRAARALPPALDATVTPVINTLWDGFDRDAAIAALVAWLHERMTA